MEVGTILKLIMLDNQVFFSTPTHLIPLARGRSVVDSPTQKGARVLTFLARSEHKNRHTLLHRHKGKRTIVYISVIVGILSKSNLNEYSTKNPINVFVYVYQMGSLLMCANGRS